MRLCYTRHAWERVHGRLSLTPAEVADLLEAGLSINIGMEPATSRVHRLFFSIPDKMCFVAVEDEANGVLITILPIDYHENIAWCVSNDAQRAARVLVTDRGAQRYKLTLSQPAVLNASASSAVFRLTAYFRDGGGNVKVANLGSWPSLPYEGSVARLFDDDAFFNAMGDRLVSKGIDPDMCEAIYIRQRSTLPTRLSIKRLPIEDGSGAA